MTLSVIAGFVMLSVIYAGLLGIIYAGCHLCWVSFMLGVIYAGCHLCWVSFMLGVIYAWCQFMLGIIYIKCHRIGLYAECHYAECCYAECRGAQNIEGCWPRRSGHSWVRCTLTTDD